MFSIKKNHQAFILTILVAVTFCGLYGCENAHLKSPLIVTGVCLNVFVFSKSLLTIRFFCSCRFGSNKCEVSFFCPASSFGLITAAPSGVFGLFTFMALWLGECLFLGVFGFSSLLLGEAEALLFLELFLFAIDT